MYGGGHPVTIRRFLKWITNYITKCYAVKGVTPPDKLTVHSARACLTSAVFVAHVPIIDTYRIVVLSLIHSFTRHYAISAAFKEDTNIGKAVLQSVTMRLPAPLPEVIAWESPIVWTHAATCRRKKLPPCNCSSRCVPYVHYMTHPPSLVHQSLPSVLVQRN